MLAHLSGKGKRWQLVGVHVLAQAGGDSLCWKSLPSQELPLQRQGPVYKERVCDGDPVPCVPHNSGTWLPRQSTLPPGAFLAAEFLTFVPSVCPWTVELLIPIIIPRLSLHSQQKSFPWVFSLKPTLQHPTPVSVGGHLSRAGTPRSVAQTTHVSLSVSWLPKTGLCTFFH